DGIDAIQGAAGVPFLVLAPRPAVCAPAAGPRGAFDVITGAQSILTQAGGGHVHIVPAAPVPAGADERLVAAGVNDAGDKDRSAVAVLGFGGRLVFSFRGRPVLGFRGRPVLGFWGRSPTSPPSA